MALYMCVYVTLGSNGFAFVEFYETQDAVRWMEDNKVKHIHAVVNCLQMVAKRNIAACTYTC